MKKLFFPLCVLAGLSAATPLAALEVQTSGTAEMSVCDDEPEEIHFLCDRDIKVKEEFPGTKSPIRIPKVTLTGHTLHFITPCEGLTLQLVQDEEVCYDVTITSDYVELPANITGVFELQILRGAYVFFAEVEL